MGRTCSLILSFVLCCAMVVRFGDGWPTPGSYSIYTSGGEVSTRYSSSRRSSGRSRTSSPSPSAKSSKKAELSAAEKAEKERIDEVLRVNAHIDYAKKLIDMTGIELPGLTDARVVSAISLPNKNKKYKDGKPMEVIIWAKKDDYDLYSLVARIMFTMDGKTPQDDGLELAVAVNGRTKDDAFVKPFKDAFMTSFKAMVEKNEKGEPNKFFALGSVDDSSNLAAIAKAFFDKDKDLRLLKCDTWIPGATILKDGLLLLLMTLTCDSRETGVSIHFRAKQEDKYRVSDKMLFAVDGKAMKTEDLKNQDEKIQMLADAAKLAKAIKQFAEDHM